jgi:hypothetical protein
MQDPTPARIYRRVLRPLEPAPDDEHVPVAEPLARPRNPTHP